MLSLQILRKLVMSWRSELPHPVISTKLSEIGTAGRAPLPGLAAEQETASSADRRCTHVGACVAVVVALILCRYDMSCCLHS